MIENDIYIFTDKINSLDDNQLEDLSNALSSYLTEQPKWIGKHTKNHCKHMLRAVDNELTSRVLLEDNDEK